MEVFNGTQREFFKQINSTGFYLLDLQGYTHEQKIHYLSALISSNNKVKVDTFDVKFDRFILHIYEEYVRLNSYLDYFNLKPILVFKPKLN
jgi:hypothetical protein